jgi:hypothetical protein
MTLSENATWIVLGSAAPVSVTSTLYVTLHKALILVASHGHPYLRSSGHVLTGFVALRAELVRQARTYLPQRVKKCIGQSERPFA